MGRKRTRKKQQRKKSSFKETLRIEMYGLIFLGISLLALVQPGAIGQVFRGFFRFFSGSWDFLLPLAMVGLSLYMILKRDWPRSWHYRWSGVVMIFVAILILSHMNLMQGVTANGQQEASVIGTTWNLFMEDISNHSPVQDLGGGMVGAVLYGCLAVLVGNVGTLLVIFFLIMIGLLLLVGVAYMDMIKGVRKLGRRFWHWFKEKRVEWKEMLDEDEDETEPYTASGQKKGGKRRERRIIADAQYEELTPDQATGPVKDPEIYDFTDVAYHEDADQADADPVVSRKVAAKSGTLGAAQEAFEADQSGLSHGQQSVGSRDASGGNGGLLLHDTASFEGDSKGVVAYNEEGREYRLPAFSLLKKPARGKNAQKQNMRSKARKLEKTLESFGVNAQVSQVHRGPAVTRYEVNPAVGVKVSRIVNLADDIALALAAKGIRIEAPIPGKSAIGIEVPNEDVSMVTLREVLESSSFHESESKLSIGLGRDISGEPIVAHLNKMPHLLVAGATGSGKSVCINGIIASILYKSKPHEVKFMMVDPKMVELNVYNGIPHLLAPVVTDPKKAAMALKKVVAEMERRYDLFAQSGTRDIGRYNDLIRQENERRSDEKKPTLPYIVVIIDELADLMMVAQADVEDAIIRLAQMARAAGIHLIIATQRPSVDVITGIIKANIPSRIAFGVSSQTDSRTILDTGGAEKLLGRGDMLFLPVGASKTLRIQGAFIADEEVEKVVQHCVGQQKAQYHEEMMPQEGDTIADEAEERDELYDEAVQLVVQQGNASVSMLQRRFRIGYNRAARLIDTLEAGGIVGPYEGSKPREVLVSKDESHIS